MHVSLILWFINENEQACANQEHIHCFGKIYYCLASPVPLYCSGLHPSGLYITHDVNFQFKTYNNNSDGAGYQSTPGYHLVHQI